MLQIDEYSRNQILARALIRACNSTFRETQSEVLVLPMLSGVPFVDLRNTLLQTSSRSLPHFFSLTGVEERGLWKRKC